MAGTKFWSNEASIKGITDDIIEMMQTSEHIPDMIRVALFYWIGYHRSGCTSEQQSYN